MSKAFLNYYRCPEFYVHFDVSGHRAPSVGYFRWGADTICYGSLTSGSLAHLPDGHLHDVSDGIRIRDAHASLPFDPEEVLENLQRERYSNHSGEGSLSSAAVRNLYYKLRPLLGVHVRKPLQRLRLRNWKSIPFPEWPVDLTVDRVHRRLLALTMRANDFDSIPFIWFWPQDYQSCAIITHDVETAEGRDFCGQLMDIDESFGFRCSFQVVPELRYAVPKSFLALIVQRGCEVNIHDLNHDGRLFEEHAEFLRRVKKINQYAHDFGARGFRAGALYRNPDWYDALEFDYDSSIPSVGHLDPQNGGCCTVLPFFIGNIIELPVTCMQDYTLFHILNEYSTSIWRRQINIITENHGLITILTHPDYLKEARAQACYKEILGYLAEMRDTKSVWTPLPREVAEWWRQRSEMKLVLARGDWHIEGPGKERAHIAYAMLAGDSVMYHCPTPGSAWSSYPHRHIGGIDCPDPSISPGAT
ncbi:MAG: hypothetical protein ABSF23_04285 [Terracidiphilus sp.]